MADLCKACAAEREGVTLLTSRKVILQQVICAAIPTIGAILLSAYYGPPEANLQKCKAREDIWE